MARHSKYRDTGILVLRLGFGVMFMMHGFPKLFAGEDTWTSIGNSMNNVGISFAPAFWGFMSALVEFGGGILLIAGLFTRVAAVFMLINMVIAALSHIFKDHSIMAAAHPIEDGIVFASLIFFGGGRYSLSALL